MTPLGVDRIEQLTRDLIAAYGMPSTVVTVRHEPPRWLIVIRQDSNRLFDIEVSDTIVVGELRAELQQQLLSLLNLSPSTELSH